MYSSREEHKKGERDTSFTMNESEIILGKDRLVSSHDTVVLPHKRKASE